jgi:hypothetical protein
MLKGRPIAWSIALGGLAVLCVCTALMIQRVRDFHRDNPRLIYAFQAVDSRSFSFAGRPITLTDDKSDPAKPRLIVQYGDQQLPLDVTIPGRYDLPALKSHEDWMRVLRFAPRTGLTEEQFQAQVDAGNDRLAIVTRTPPAGADPETWAKVWKKNWVFDFYEFKPDGSIQHQTLRYPTARGLKKPKDGELHENTWEHQAALQIMPNAGQTGPTRNFYGDALAAAGITLPLAAFAGLASFLGFAFAIAPRKRTATTA